MRGLERGAQFRNGAIDALAVRPCNPRGDLRPCVAHERGDNALFGFSERGNGAAELGQPRGGFAAHAPAVNHFEYRRRAKRHCTGRGEGRRRLADGINAGANLDGCKPY